MKNLVFFDLETTSKNAHQAEIITAYFKCVNPYDMSTISEFYQEVKPQNWGVEAELIHGISLSEAELFEDKKTALPKIYEYIWHKLDCHFLCYANPNNFGNYYLYDWAVLKQAAFDISDTFYFHWLDRTRNAKIDTVYLMVKEKLKLKGYSQRAVADYYGIEYKAHDAKEDVNCLIKIYERLQNERSELLI